MAKKDNKTMTAKSTDDAGKAAALGLAVDQITKQFGDGSIMKLGDAYKIEVETIPSGTLSLDLALGGGYPKGRIVEVYGPESSGKTTLTLHAIAEVQKQGGTAAFIDAEHALDPAYAKRLGVDTTNLLVSQPDNGEQALEIVETLVRSNAVDLIVLDSVAALVPQAEIDGDMGDSLPGLQARLMSQALRKLTGIITNILAESDDYDEMAALRKMIAKKINKYDDERKLVAYLARQGFKYDDIKSALVDDEN